VRSVLVVVCLVTGVALGGCKCANPPPLESSPQPPKAEFPAPDDDWFEGRLPATVHEGTPRPGGTLVVRLHVEPPHLLPRVIDPFDAMATRIALGRIYETLLRADTRQHPNYPLVPAAAESWEESEDHRVFTFKLRSGMTFHDGKPVTAHDVVATLDRILDPKEPTASARSYFTGVKAYRAVDDRTFRIELKEPYFLFIRQLGTSLPILPRHLLAKGLRQSNLAHKPVGSGPWKLESWEPMSEEIVLARNDAYWGRKPLLDKLRFKVVKDHTVATQLFERGDFDVMTQIQHSVWVEMDRNRKLVEGYYRVRFFGNNYEWVGWNQARPFFADKRVRTALALLFDRESFNRTIGYNLELPTNCHFFHESPECNLQLPPLPFDPARAEELLKEADWVDHDGDGVLDKDGVPFRFSFLMPSNSVFLGKLAVVLQKAYEAVGIKVDIVKVEWAEFARRVYARDFDACSMLWMDTDAASDPYQIWHSSQSKGGSNVVGFHHSRADELMEKARVTFDPDARAQLYQELGRILYQEQPYLWLNVRPDLDAVGKRVRGIRPSLANYNFEEIWLAD